MYSIGEFSKITSLSIKAIHHYQEKGILLPSRIDESSGYRYFGNNEVERARVIIYLKDMTFSISEISEILSDFEDEMDLVEFLSIKKTAIEKKIKQMQNVKISLNAIIVREQEVKKMIEKGQFEVEEKEIKEQLIAVYDWTGRYDETGKAFKKLFRHAGRYSCGKPFNLYHHAQYEEGECEISTCVPVKKEFKAEGIRIEKMEAKSCATLIHKGPYDEIGRSYKRLIDHLKEKGDEFELPFYEVYIKGPGMILKGNPQNYLTEIQVALKS
jgi:DNA-binding transcriptional MerR regulator